MQTLDYSDVDILRFFLIWATILKGRFISQVIQVSGDTFWSHFPCGYVIIHTAARSFVYQWKMMQAMRIFHFNLKRGT